MTVELGHGLFGGVFIGTWKRAQGQMDVAVKTLKNLNAKTEEKVKFLQEAAIMAQFKHPNVIQLYGIVNDTDCVSYEFITSD